jgi:HEPN domain-containing protein
LTSVTGSEQKTDPAGTWWAEAAEQLLAATELLDLKRYGSAVFHAWMALELAIKATRLAPARNADLDFSIEQLDAFAVGTLGGLEHKKGHNELLGLLNALWHPRAQAEHALATFEALERDLGIKPDQLYMACRYPDAWRPNAYVVPHNEFERQHADRAIAAALSFIQCVRDRFERP